jgi:hypothetical protein
MQRARLRTDMSTPALPASHPSQNGRWRQFSLRSLLVLILLCAVGLALWSIYIEPYRRQRGLVEKIADLKGVVTTESVPTFWSRVFGDDFFINIVLIRFLVISATKVTDAGMVSVQNLHKLESLGLNRTSVIDEGLASPTSCLSLLSWSSQKRR